MALALSGGGGGGGGYTPPTTRGQLSGVPVSIADNTNGVLTWDTDNEYGPGSLLDITNPSAPLIIDAGVYAATVSVWNFDQLTVGGYFRLTLSMDTAGENATISTDSPPAIASTINTLVSASLVYYCPAGAALQVVVTNKDGAAARNFQLTSAVVQRLA